MSKTYTKEDIKIGTKYIFGDSYYDEKNPFEKLRLQPVTILDIKDGYVLYSKYYEEIYTEMSDTIERFIDNCNLGEKQKEKFQ